MASKYKVKKAKCCANCFYHRSFVLSNGHKISFCSALDKDCVIGDFLAIESNVFGHCLQIPSDYVCSHFLSS